MSIEVNVPYVMEDFSIGDEVYRTHQGEDEILFCILKKMESPTLMNFLGEDGRRYVLPVSHFVKRDWVAPEIVWGKLLPVTALQAGSRISRKTEDDKERVFASITEYQPPTTKAPGMLGYVRDDDPARVYYFPVPTMRDVKVALVGWELEE